jgi:hypothetical protein
MWWNCEPVQWHDEETEGERLERLRGPRKVAKGFPAFAYLLAAAFCLAILALTLRAGCSR